uniref:Intercellular adhesion molecule N-terminal domain-containing protein n=1 Tax=Pseudonaja textilis TaxID=8673 RepID=A0A670YAZ6_PSETE
MICFLKIFCNRLLEHLEFNFLCCDTCIFLYYVEIWPPNPVVKFGGSLDLNCTSTCENIGIESAYTKVPIENGSNWKAFRLSNVDYWAASPMCYADCKTGQKKSPKANIIVYKTPDHVKLDTVPKMEVGKQYNLTCRVSGVAPIWNLSVTLLKGEEQLLVKTFEDYSDPKTNDVVVNHLITALQHDHHKTVTCQTSLDLNPTGPLLKNTSHNITLESFGEISFIASIPCLTIVHKLSFLLLLLKCTSKGSLNLIMPAFGKADCK